MVGRLMVSNYSIPGVVLLEYLGIESGYLCVGAERRI